MTLVVDASVTLAWILPGERTSAVEGTIDRITTEGAVVPGLWRLEVGNVLGVVVRRGQMSVVQRDQVVAALRAWPIAVDDETDRQAWSTTLRLADRHKLMLYDAAYLELADRRGLPLATLDRALIRAAGAIGVPVCA